MHQVVKTIIIVLHSVLHSYYEDQDHESLRLLRHGASLLSVLSQQDRLYGGQHRDDVEHQYVSLVFGLNNIFGSAQGVTDAEGWSVPQSPMLPKTCLMEYI